MYIRNYINMYDVIIFRKIDNHFETNKNIIKLI